MNLPYQVGALLGAGGTAAVFRARGTSGAEVALRVLHAHLAADPRAVARFLEEAQATAGLRHPHLATTLDAGRSEGVIWAATGLVEGVTVAELVELGGPLPVDDALRVVIGVLEGLAHGHAHGLVHLDLSAANVMVPVADDRPVLDGAVVLDLGERQTPGAKAAAPAAASVPGRPELVRVSPHFASPEVATGAHTGTAADVYSAACLLHLLLTGHPPFVAGTPAEVLEQQVAAPPPRPSVSRAGVSPGLDDLVVASLAKCPETRPWLPSLLAGLRRELAASRALPGAVVRVAPIPPVATPRLPPAATARSRDVAPSPAPRRRPARSTSRGGPLRALGVLGVLSALVAAGVSAAAGEDAPAGDRPPGAGVTETTPAPAVTAGPPPAPEAAPALETAAATVTVPDLTDLTVAGAAAALVDVGLEPEVAVQDEPAPEGTVAGQTPAPGSTVAGGTTVRLVVASGYVVVPDVVGREPHAAGGALRGLGFDVRTVDETAATVGSTTPSAGRRVPFGSTVLLLPPLGGAGDADPGAGPTPSASPPPSGPAAEPSTSPSPAVSTPAASATPTTLPSTSAPTPTPTSGR